MPISGYNIPLPPLEEKIMHVVNDTINQATKAGINYVKSKTGHKRRRSSQMANAATYGTGGPYKGLLCPKKKYGTYRKGGKLAVVGHREIASTVTDPNVAFVGMGLNYEYIFTNIYRALVKALFEQAGIQCGNPDNNIDGTFQIQYSYYIAFTSTLTTSRTVGIGGGTLNQKAALLQADIAGAFGAGNPHRIKEFRLDGTQNLVNQPMATIMASNFILTINISQALLVQNQTIGAAAADTTNEAVTANPLFYAVYDGAQNVVFQKERSDTTDASYVPMVFWNDARPEFQDWTAANNFIDLPNTVANFFSNAYKKYTGVLNPGDMKKVQSQYTLSGSFNRFVREWDYTIVDSTNPQPMRGGCRIIAFDKMLDSDSTNLIVGYEGNQTIRVSYTYKNIRTLVPNYE